MKNNQEKKIIYRDRIHNLNVFLFLGFNLTLISVLGFIWFRSSTGNIV